MYRDDDFTDLYPVDGHPAEHPWRLALVTVLQFVENLTDRQAAEAVRARIDWKYALSLELTDPGFDFTVLSQFRTRLLAGGDERRLLDRLLELLKEQGLLKARGRQRTDSAHVLAAVRELDGLERVGETLRQALNVLAQVAPKWLQAQIDAAWAERYGRPFYAYRLPRGEAAVVAFAEQIGRDGETLLDAIRRDAPTWLAQIPAVETLRQIWLQRYEVDHDQQVRWRRAGNLPPGARQICSPYDVEARFSQKRQTTWVGYKVQLTETCDIEGPLLVTDVQTTQATTHEADLVPTHCAASSMRTFTCCAPAVRGATCPPTSLPGRRCSTISGASGSEVRGICSIPRCIAPSVSASVGTPIPAPPSWTAKA